MVDDQNRCKWVNVSSGTRLPAHPGRPGQRAILYSILIILYRTVAKFYSSKEDKTVYHLARPSSDVV